MKIIKNLKGEFNNANFINKGRKTNISLWNILKALKITR